MAINKIPVEELKPGMVFDRSVYIDENNILAAPMVPLKEEDIKRLIKWGIKEVETEGEIVKEGVHSKTKREAIREDIKRLKKLAGVEEKEAGFNFDKFYDETVELIRDVFESAKSGVSYSNDQIYAKADRLIEYIKRDKYTAIEVAIKEHDKKYLYVLGASVAILSAITGSSLGFNDSKLRTLIIGSWLHDIGMIKIPPYIIEKRGKLTPDEYARIKTHTIYGYRLIIGELLLNNEIATIALQHHESYDGTGYPRKLKGNQISINARIVSIADSYVAMTRKRSYRDEMIYYNAMKVIVSAANRRFDPTIVKVFLANMAIYPVGSIVRLNNGIVAKVVKSNPNLPLRPVVEVLVDEFGEKVKEERFLDLQNETGLFIKNPLTKEEIGKLKL